MRAADAVATVAEAEALAALWQCLVAPLCDTSLPDPLKLRTQLPRVEQWLAEENKHRAARYAMDAEFVFGANNREPARRLAGRLAEQLHPVAQQLGCEAQLERIQDMLSWRESAIRQRYVMSGDGSAYAVLDALAQELETDTATPVPANRSVAAPASQEPIRRTPRSQSAPRLRR
jgi:carboxylate-amine ligase